ncbi:MAG: vitamin K epoxide reductase family protein [Conexibacter sp.]
MSDRVLHRTLIGLALIGLGIAGYLTYIHYQGLDPICAVGHGCEKVQNSKYAKVSGVPVPLIGLIGYVAILVSLFVRGELARLATAAMAYGGVAFSAYLTYLELFEINAICQWCVGSAIVMTLIAIVATIRVLNAPDEKEAEAVPPPPSPPPSRVSAGPEHEPV